MLHSGLSAFQEMHCDIGMLGFDAEELNRIKSGEVQAELPDPNDVPEPPG